ncbi:MAG: hypothetical protein LBC74_11250, partial [Planctomycetaceae bacterium]|nr:hypothetical protein [Planctomycetaceae bacterium]
RLKTNYYLRNYSVVFLTTPTPSEGGELNSPPSEGVGVVKKMIVTALRSFAACCKFFSRRAAD